MKLYYRCTSHCEESFYKFESEFPFTPGDDLDYVAEEAAEDYHKNHDGFESEWPLTFSIHETEDGPELDRYIVFREMSPTFNAVPAASAT